MARKLQTLIALGLGFCVGAVTTAQAADGCRIVAEKPFSASEKVRQARPENLGSTANLALFRAPLAVNTDGAPTSYHPDDFRGTHLAINRIDNGIAIRASGGGSLPLSKKIEVFDAWRSSPNWRVPAGFTIGWKNVIAADAAGKPCIFKTANAGYFGSLTALKNGLSGAAAGECQANDQLDQRAIPAIVLRGNSNPLIGFGAKVGDLVLAINPANGVVVPAIIGDSGDDNRIGEGSVALNMALLGQTNQPKTYSEALGLDTGTQKMVVAVLPGTRQFERIRPYSADNIAARVASWANSKGYSSLEGLKAAALQCAEGL